MDETEYVAVDQSAETAEQLRAEEIVNDAHSEGYHEGLEEGRSEYRGSLAAMSVRLKRAETALKLAYLARGGHDATITDADLDEEIGFALGQLMGQDLFRDWAASLTRP